MGYFFGFESAQERTLALIPMVVRMKLDTCAIKLKLAQWNRFPEADRRRLFELPCETTPQIDMYRSLLCELVHSHTGQTAQAMPPCAFEWQSTDCVPAQVVDRAHDAGVPPPSLSQWRALTAAQRYALLKLTREGRSSENYVPAMREFALV